MASTEWTLSKPEYVCCKERLSYRGTKPHSGTRSFKPACAAFVYNVRLVRTECVVGYHALVHSRVCECVLCQFCVCLCVLDDGAGHNLALKGGDGEGLIC